MEAALRPEEWSEHVEALRRMARELLREEHLAEDLVQTAWLAALERPPRVLSRGWLTSVLRSRAQDLYRRDGRRAGGMSELAEGDESATTLDAGEIAQRLELHELLSAAVRKLDEPYRRVVYLRYFEELSPTEIARRLRLPLKTVKTRLHRALALLRGRMEREFGEGANWQSAILPLALERTSLGALTRIGFGIMLKKLVLVGVALLAFLGLYRMLNPGSQVEPAAIASEPSIPQQTDAPVGAEVPTPAADEPARHALASEERAAPISAPAPPSGSLLVRVVWSDGEPAEDIGVACHIETPGLPQLGIRRAVTDPDGVARLQGLPVGAVELRSDRGDRLDAEVVVGEERELRLVLADRLDVAGRVVDLEGQSVAGAGIWLTNGSNDWLGGRIVTRSAADGSFFVRSMQPEQSLGAIAAGYEPSPLVDLDTIDKTAPPAEVELKLAAAGGALRVRIQDNAAPVADAVVAVGDAPGYGNMRLSGGVAEVWSPRSESSDAEGTVLFEGLSPGEQDLSVRADGCGVWNGRVTVVAGETAETTIELPAGVTLSGFVRDAEGDPIPGAVIRVFDVAVEETFITGGQYDYESAFGYASTSADAQGAYRLGPLAPGTIHLYATLAREGWARGSLAHVHRTIEAAPGASLDYDIDLVPGPTIAGRVTFQDGHPMPDVFVAVADEETNARQSTVTTDDGRFAFYSLKPTAYTVSVQLWDAPKDAPPLNAEHVWPDSGELLLEAGFPMPVDEAPGEIRLRFHDAGKRLAHPDALSMAMHSDKGWFRTRFERDGDDYVFTDMPPGRYRANILSGDNAIYSGDWFELEAGALKDLGVLETEEGGALRIELDRPPGTEELEPKIWISPEVSPHGSWVEFGRESTRVRESLSPGSWALSLYGQGLASSWSKAEVEVGETAVVRFTLRAAVKRSFEVHYPDGVTLAELHLQIYDAAGAELWDWADPSPTDHGRPYRRDIMLPLGLIKVRVDTDVGLSASTELTMTSLEPDQAPVRLDLR